MEGRRLGDGSRDGEVNLEELRRRACLKTLLKTVNRWEKIQKTHTMREEENNREMEEYRELFCRLFCREWNITKGTIIGILSWGALGYHHRGWSNRTKHRRIGRSQRRSYFLCEIHGNQESVIETVGRKLDIYESSIASGWWYDDDILG